MKHTIVKCSRLFYATNILYQQFSKIIKCLTITPPLNKQQVDSEISENPVSQKKCFEKMFNVKEKTSKQYSRNRNYLLFELSRCTNFDINLFVPDFEKLINLINKRYCYATFQYLPIPNLQWLLEIADKKQASGMIYYEIFLKKLSGSSH